MNYKKFIALIIVITSFGGTYNSLAQEADFELISKIIRAGNAKDLVQQFNKTVQLNIDGEEASYSQAQAEAVFKDFFSKNSPLSFSINHTGTSKAGLVYAIGVYKNKADDYRVYIRLKNVEGKILVYEINFDKI